MLVELISGIDWSSFMLGAWAGIIIFILFVVTIYRAIRAWDKGWGRGK